jgi:hypothetical protein
MCTIFIFFKVISTCFKRLIFFLKSISTGFKRRIVIPKFFTPSFYSLSKCKNWIVLKAIIDNAWLLQSDISNGLSVTHLHEFTNLWYFTSRLTLIADARDSIIWKLTDSGTYSCHSANIVQFSGLILSLMDTLV